ncbi:hypothetical protein CIK05_04035 [Bdellovibrio sp. qaytius]|nr:hypothetical protein CIK05_04035 [Bdellovibrio sp. qaytius]
MDKNLLIYPMAFYAFWMFLIALNLFRVRVKTLKNREVSFKYFKAYTDTATLPEYAKVAERHYENQFEVPTMFFPTGVMYFALGMANPLTLGLMWLFVASRVAHTFIHLGSNNVRFRMISFFIGWLAIVALWAQAVYFVCKAH